MNIKRQFTKKTEKVYCGKNPQHTNFIHIPNIILSQLLKKIFNFAIVFSGRVKIFYFIKEIP